ncbi:cytochrome c biogenesis protein ResB [Pyrinomonas sp.]|uniref:cytochrome c biogenesis protein ResB n=1 Tax=Pyrinomonas sp. TaxID=2080306 RepID=UPI003320F5B5
MSAVTETKEQVVRAARVPIFTRLLERTLKLLSSVRFGIVLLVLLVIVCMIGMLVMQQNVDGFAEYYAKLTPAQRVLYGALGFFDIYHTWYFNALLLLLSLNITLASIERFPGAWTYIRSPKKTVAPAYLRSQRPNVTFCLNGESVHEVVARIAEACRRAGLKPTITDKGERTFVFAERGAWNRLGAYAVHLALLTIFFGGFMTAQLGRNGLMELAPGMSSSVMSEPRFELNQIKRVGIRLPFTVECVDIQQKLIHKDGPILPNNTIDWLTRIRIHDENGTHEALVHLNNPHDYRGYRFFQASFISLGSARQITVQATSTDGTTHTVVIPRNGSASLPDGTRLDYVQFFPDFRFVNGRPDTASGEYNNPAAQLRITTPLGQEHTAFAFGRALPTELPVAGPVGGYRFRLLDFEKAPLAHVLSIQYDPGARVVYLGFALLALTLALVFFFSHQRVWAMVEPDGTRGYTVTLAGHTNRNQLGFEDRFKRLVQALGQNANEINLSPKKGAKKD